MRSLLRYAYGMQCYVILLDGEARSALGATAIDGLSAAGSAHPLAKTLQALLLEIAFLCCSFRHFPAPWRFWIGAYYNLNHK